MVRLRGCTPLATVNAYKDLYAGVDGVQSCFVFLLEFVLISREIMTLISPASLLLLATSLAADGILATAVTRRTSSIQWVDCASNVPSTLTDANVTLPASLPSTLACGRLDVPMDYSQPISDNNTITLGFSMYRPENPQALLNL